MVLSSAIVCDHDRRIADDRRPYCDLRSAIIWKPAFSPIFFSRAWLTLPARIALASARPKNAKKTFSALKQLSVMLIDRTETRSNVDILAAHTIEFRDFRTMNIFTNGKPMNSLIINLFWLRANYNRKFFFKILTDIRLLFYWMNFRPNIDPVVRLRSLPAV